MGMGFAVFYPTNMRVFIVQQYTERVKREERKGREKRERRERNCELKEKCTEIKIRETKPNEIPHSLSNAQSS
jgi:uncharacterized transporter YbjL